MVNVYNRKGELIYREPPYTEEEEMELYKAMSYAGGGATILHGSPDASPPSPPKAPQPQAGKPRRS
jgi:hypothetical protein